MAKRLRLFDKQGNPVVFDIGSASVTIDAEGKSLDVKLSELVAAIASTVKSVTFNGNTPTIDAYGNVNLGKQMNPDWNESNPNWPSFIANKPSVPSRTSQLQNDSGFITEDDLPEGVECDTQMSSTSVKPVQNKVIKAYVDNLINGLIDGAPAALDTLKELADALGDNDDAIATIINTLSSKANANEVVKSISVNGQTQQKDTNGNVNIQVQGGGERGPKGDKGDKGDTVVLNPQGLPQFSIVNDLTTGGPSDALSAEMGKRVAGREATDRQRIDAIVSILKNSVFTTDQSSAIAALDELADATDSISLDKPNYLFNGVSGSLTLVATTDPSGKTVYWSSSDTSVATVNNGVVTPVAVGSTIISATTEDGKVATCTVTVQAFAVDTVSIDQSSTTYDGEVAGTTHQLTATTSPAGGAVLWSSGNTSVATINETTGLLAIVGEGQTTITAMDATRTKTDTITITATNVVVPSITLNQNTITSNGEDVGEHHQLIATVVPNTDTVQWSSSDDDVATVDNTGLVTIVGNGDCTITATSSRGLSATCAVTVSNVQTQYVDFQGDNVAKAIVLANYPHTDTNEITKAECAAVTSLLVEDPENPGSRISPFRNTGISNGDFFQYFTGIQAIDDPDVSSDQYSGFGRMSDAQSIFRGCNSLSRIIVPEGIKRIGGNAFVIKGLRTITLPSTVTSLRQASMIVNNDYTDNVLTIKATTPPSLGYGIAAAIDEKFSIVYVPYGSGSAYTSAWSSLASKITELPE